MIFSRIVSSVVVIFLIASCAPRQTAKEVKTETPSTAGEIKLPELPPQRPAETKETKKVEPVRIEKEADEKYVILNFDGADIETVISTIGELLNMNYILGAGVSGKVTIQSYKKFPVRDLFQIFQTILELNGLTAVKDGAFYRIVPIDTAKQQPVPIEIGKEPKFQIDSSFITQIIPLEHVKANDVVNILRNLMPRGTDIVVYEPTNLLIITSLPSGLVKFMKVLEAVDVSAVELESVRTFVYYVENGEAKKLADILKHLYSEKKETKGVVPRPIVPPPTAPKGLPVTTESLPGEIEGEMVIVAYEDINSILVKTSPRSYVAILETLKKLDVPVKQVLIEVLIAEIKLSDSTKLGIEWLLKAPVHAGGGKFTSLSGYDSSSVDFPGTIDTDITSVSGPAGSYFASIINPDRFGALLTAFAGFGKVNVLASPHILAMDNKEANIQIGEDLPVATGLTQQPSTAGGTTLVSSGQIQYKTVGTILTVKPHITEKNRVTLDITQEQSQLGEKIPIAGQDFQGFNTRKAKTTAVVQSGHSLVLGGLISETKSEGRSGIPFLSNIPVLGHLFSTTSNSFSKTELVVMVTPHVLNNQEEADALTREFQNRVKTIKKRLDEIKPLEESKIKNFMNITVERDSPLMDIIESSGYTLTDEDYGAFLSEFLRLNSDIKDIKLIEKGSVIRLPLNYLKKQKSAERR
ncbi:MAG: hypothetical protein HY754_06490 [Nitrospirae bacterium]|nr:hypothetical protein [Nitrospirota bacterium]